MGQIVGGAAKPKRCNLNKLSQLGTPAAGEYILVSSDNSMNAAGQGDFDAYVKGDGVTPATELPLKKIDGLAELAADLIQELVPLYDGVQHPQLTIDTKTGKVVSNANWKSVVLPIVGGDEYLIKLIGTQVQYAFLVNNTIVASATPNYATGYTTGLVISEDTQIVAPSDANYIIFSEGRLDNRKYPYFYHFSNGSLVKESDINHRIFEAKGRVSDSQALATTLAGIALVDMKVEGEYMVGCSISSNTGVIVSNASLWQVFTPTKQFSKGDVLAISNTVYSPSGFTIAEYAESPELGSTPLYMLHIETGIYNVTYEVRHGQYIAISTLLTNVLGVTHKATYAEKNASTMAEDLDKLAVSLKYPYGKSNFDGFSSPLDYTFKLVSTRRDYYNKADSLLLKSLDFSNNMFLQYSNLLPAIATGYVHTWENGKIKFSNPTQNNATCLLWVDKYFPFVTSIIGIDNIAGGDQNTVGVRFGDAAQSNYVQVRASQTGIIAELYVNGNREKIKNIYNISIVGCKMAVQNTGRAVIIFKIENGIWTALGRFEYGGTFDGRQASLLDTWSTYLLAFTASYTENDVIMIDSYETLLASGSNSVSIRFLTYEDGTFIQEGNWMYYLVEGTGATISDLYTQICKVNFNTMDVQMIGAIFQRRKDVDGHIILGDDSIKVVYDRNDGKWKGISCGMEYYDYISDNLNRPKLYFETKQNILEGGLIIVNNSVQLMTSGGQKWGTKEDPNGYCEDIDFYFDSVENNWRFTGNSVSNGCKTYRSVGSAIDSGMVLEYSTESVPTEVRDTGNQFVKVGGTLYLTTGGRHNKLHLRATGEGLAYLGQFTQDIYLNPDTYGPWCTLCPYTNGDRTEMYMLSFDRTYIYDAYDHGGLYIWRAIIK